MLLKDLIKIYFLEYPTTNFSQIRQTIKKYEKAVEKYKSINLPSWVEGKAKDISLNTVNFIRNNIHLLTLSKKFYTYQEYQQLLKFKPALQNLGILTKEKNKIDLISKRTNKNTTGIVISLIISLFIFVLFGEQIYQQLYIWNKEGLITILGGIISFIALLIRGFDFIMSAILGSLFSGILFSSTSIPSQYFYTQHNEGRYFFTYSIIFLFTIFIIDRFNIIRQKGEKLKKVKINSSNKTLNNSLHKL